MLSLAWKNYILILVLKASWLGLVRANGCYANGNDPSNGTGLKEYSVTCLNRCRLCALNQAGNIFKDFEAFAVKQTYSALCGGQPQLTLTEAQKTSTGRSVAALCLSNGWTRYPFPLNDFSNVVVLDGNKISDLQPILNSSYETTANSTPAAYQTEILSLQKNSIFNISQEFFQDFRNLKVLILRHNSLTFLNWTVGLTKSSLLVLDLSYNKLSMVDGKSFGVLASLQRLDLSHNSISSIGTDSFTSFSSLLHLDVSHNLLKSGSIFKNAFQGLGNLTFLSLANNRQLSNLPLFDYIGLSEANLQTLDLHKLTAVTVIETFTFYGLKNLKKLNLSGCSLSDLRQGWLNGGPESSLETLDLSCNRFRSIKPYYFVGIDERKSRLSCPQFKFYKLKYSDEKYIVLNNSPQFYRSLKNLKWLSLEENFQLRLLDDDSFSFVPNLFYLFLQRCNISILNIPSRKLIFENNALHKTIPELRGLWIFDNPLHCDCRIRNVISGSTLSNTVQSASNCSEAEARENLNQTLKFQVDSKQYYYEHSCHSVKGAELSHCFPFANMNGYELSNVPASFLHCANEPMVLLVAMMIGPLVFIVTIGLLLLCGFCSVLIRRLHRPYYYPAVYQPSSQHHHPPTKKPLTSTASISSYGGSVTRRPVEARSRQPYSRQTPAVGSSSKRHFQTNLVLSKFNSTAHEEQRHPTAVNPIRDGRMGKSSFRKNVAVNIHSLSSSSIQSGSTSSANQPQLESSKNSPKNNPKNSPQNKSPDTNVFELEESESRFRFPSIKIHKVDPPLREKKIRFIDEDSEVEEVQMDKETEFIVTSADPQGKSLNKMLTFL